MSYNFLRCFGVLLVLNVNVIHASERELASESNVVRLLLEQPYSCASTMSVKIEAKSADYFDQSPMVIQRLVNTSSAILGFECPAISKLEFIGYTDSVIVFKAGAQKNEKWALKTEPPPLEALALVYGLYEPHFFHLGQIYKLLEPYQHVTGIESSYQYEALMKQIERLAETIDGDMIAFKAYLVNPGQNFAVFEQANQNYQTVLSAIKAFAPEQYPAYENTYEEFSIELKDEFWASKVEEVINTGATVGDSINAAQSIVQQDEIGDFAAYLDTRLANWLKEETDYIVQELPEGGLYEVAWTADFLAGFSDQDHIRRLPHTTAQVKTSRAIILDRLNTALENLTNIAMNAIKQSGDTYLDVDIILETGFSLAEDFEVAGFAEQAELLIGETSSYIETTIDDDLQNFEAELSKSDFSAQSVLDLKQQASVFAELSSQFPTFSKYNNAIEQALDANKNKICNNLLSEIGVNPSDFGKQIFVGSEAFTLSKLNCNLYEQGARVSGFESNWTPGSYSLSIENSEGVTTNYGFKADHMFSGQDLRVQSLFDEDGEKPVSQENWASFIAALVQPPPSGQPDANGIRECDRLAADPHDPKKLTQGIDFEEGEINLDAFERAIDACIAAVEHDSSDPRQIYQLGRLLWFSGDQEMAKDYIGAASLAEYAPALYYQAEILLSLSDDPDAFIDALDLYTKSGQLGYVRGKEMVKELNPDGIEFFKEIPPPTGSEIVASLNQKGKSISMFGMTSSIKIVDAKVKDCFQTSATDFSCEYKKIAKCGVSGWGNDPMVGFLSRAMQADCNSAPYTFGSFKKVSENQWKELPSQF